MARRLEKVDFTSPTALALEIAVVGLIAWRYRTNILRQHDEPGQAERVPTPLGQDTEDGFVYVVAKGSDFEVGMKHDDKGFIAISGVRGEEGLQIDESTLSPDLENLRTLYESIRRVRRSWAHRKKV